MNVSNMTLVKVAAIGGIATVSMGLLTRNKIQNNIKATPFYKDALKTVRMHSGAVQLLGEPIKDKSINIDDQKNNFCKENVAQYQVPLKGSKQRGILYFWAEKSSKEPWKINRIELEVENCPEKRLLIKSVIDTK